MSAEFVRAASVGLARSGWRPPEGQSPLQALALAGQRARLVPPTLLQVRIPDAAAALHADPRPILPEPARRALVRLVADGKQTRERLDVALERLAKAGLRLHPFDLPRLEAALIAAPRHLGAAERAYLQLVGRATASEPVTAATWMECGKSERLAFFRTLRRRDPAAARALFEASHATDSADLRSALLEEMRFGLSAEDLPLLEKLSAGRASGVKKIADSLSRSVPGTAGNQELARQVAAIVFEKGVFGVRLKGGIDKAGADALAELARVRIEDIAAAIGVEPKAILKAGAKQYRVADAMAAAAIRNGDYTRVAELRSAGAELELVHLTSLQIGAALDETPPEERLGLARHMFDLRSPALISTEQWQALRERLSAPLPIDLADVILRSDYLSLAPKIHGGRVPDIAFAVAALMPRARAEAMLRAVESIDGPLEPARNLLSFILALPTETP